MREQSNGRSLVKNRMHHFFPLALLPRGNDLFSTRFRQQHSAIVPHLEVVRLELNPVDQRQRQTVREYRPKFLHQIQR